jgi:DNA invertase Pin-like site-specific DNA recombinase
VSPRKPSKPFDGYIRVSRVAGRRGDSFISPDVQSETIERLAALHRIELGEVVEEFDVSGGRPIEERELGRLVRKIEAGESGGLIVWKVSRFSRSLRDGVAVADRIAKAGGRIIGEDLDTAAPMGKAILGFLLGWAEEELDARRAGWREARERAAARGVWPTRVPIGYVKGADGRLEVDPETAPVVAEVFRMRAGGASLGACAARLQETAPGRAGGSRSAVKALLGSQAYLGRIVAEDGLYVESAHRPIVDERTWHLAQRSGPKPVRNGAATGRGVLLGLLRCAGCGNPMTITLSGPPDARVPSYTCRKLRASGVCPSPAAARVDLVDALVIPGLDKRAKPAADVAAARAEAETTADALTAAEKELDAFLAGALVGELGRELYAREVARRREAVETATEAHRTALDALQEFHAAEVLPRASDEFRRGEARRLIESATLTRSTRGRWQPLADRLEVIWR